MASFSEEEIRSNIIIPLLRDIGFSYNDLSLETSFTIQLGRGVYDVKNEQKKFIGGRLDILCKADSKNLFIIELKAEDVSIDKFKDLYQALSYARLLQSMPPYVILSNGRETFIFNTLNGEEVNKDYLIKNGFSINIEDEVLFRFNALKNFIGYSYDNLIVFCNSFNAEHLKPFCSLDDEAIEQQLAKKYIPKLYVNREKIKQKFAEFISQNEKTVFAIVGESGAGKTNEIIDILLNYNDVPSLFYSGTLLGNSFFNDLKFDFNLEFSPQETELTIFKKLSLLTENHNKSFIFFIDAIDEWVAYDKMKQLEDLVKVTSRYNIKICLSCKDIMWPSFLSNNGISTYLSSKLFDPITINNFDNEEFNEALVKYSNYLSIGVESENVSPEYHNPFTMRIAFEVSFKENHPLYLNTVSADIVESYINQKISKAQPRERSKRYLIEVAENLLLTNKVHEDENLLRKALGLGINEEIPVELFTNNLLYRNNGDNISYIGFYFSKIRDHIVASNVLRLNKLDDVSKTKIIIKSLKSYIGQNAINYYFKIVELDEKKLFLKAFSEFDKINSTTIYITLLAEQDIDFYVSLSREFVNEILKHIIFILENYKDENNRADEIITILNKISLYFNIEFDILDILRALNRSKDAFDISPQLSRILYKYDSKEATYELVELLTDTTFSSRIRRFIIDALNRREFDNRKSILIALLEEEIKNRSEVYYYAKHWYQYVEDYELRDKFLSLLDSERDGIKDYILHTVGFSTLEDTGLLLFEKFKKNKYSEHITCWLCRAICDQGYHPAVSLFIELFESNPDSELAGHILIGLGDMKAREFMPTLFRIIENLKPDYKNTVWLPHAFKPIATEADYDYLYQLAKGSSNNYTILFAVETLSASRNPKYYDLIIETSNNDHLNILDRVKIFNAFEHNLCSEDKDGVSYMKFIEKNADELYRNGLNKIYNILNKKTELSPIALSILINFEVDLDFLSDKIIEILPSLTYQIHFSRIMFVNMENLKKLAPKLNAWLRKELLSIYWPNPTFLFNCIQLCSIIGNKSILDSIESNKEVIIKTLALSLQEQSAEDFLSFVTHKIRMSDTEVRILL